MDSKGDKNYGQNGWNCITGSPGADHTAGRRSGADRGRFGAGSGREREI